MQDLTDSIKNLTGIINEMRKHFDVVDSRMGRIELQINSLENAVRELRFVIENFGGKFNGARKD